MSEGQLTFTDLRAVHIVAYVKLDSGKVGIARHFPAAFGVVDHCEFAQSTRVIFEAEVVVVAPAYYKLLVGRRYVSAYLFGILKSNGVFSTLLISPVGMLSSFIGVKYFAKSAFREIECCRKRIRRG